MVCPDHPSYSQPCGICAQAEARADAERRNLRRRAVELERLGGLLTARVSDATQDHVEDAAAAWGTIRPREPDPGYAEARAAFEEAIERSQDNWMPALDARSARAMCERIDQLDLDVEQARAELISTRTVLGLFRAQVALLSRRWVVPLLDELDVAMGRVASGRPLSPDDIAQRLEAAHTVSDR